MNSNFARNAIVLGLLTASGPFAIDMYLPALPGISTELHASTIATQGSLMAFFLAVALLQIVYGPVSDSFGRRPPIYFGLALYSVAAIGCSLAPSIEWLIVARFIQGIGACAVMTIPRAIVRDLHTGNEAARLMALIMLVFSVSPILAPLTGSLVTQFGSWREIFWVLAVVGVLGLALVATVQKETRPPADRIPFRPSQIVRNYLVLLRDRNYVGIVLIGGFGMSSFFSYLAGSSFIYIDHFGLTPTQYSFAFSVNAIAFIGMAQATGWFGRKFGLHRTVNAALAFYLVMASALLVVTLVGVDSAYVLIAMLFLAFGSLGLVIPSTAALALEDYGPTAGTASALMGTLQLVVGAVVVGLVGTFSNGTQLPMVVAIACCAVVAFLLGRVTLKHHAPEAVTEAAPAE